MKRSVLGVAALLAIVSAGAAHAQSDSAAVRLTLSEAIERALQVSPDIVRARNTVGTSEWAQRTAFAAYLPSLSVSAGAGWLGGPDVPYLTTGVGLRTRGRLRLAVEAELDWYHVEFTDVTREWRNGQVVREVSREDHGRWWRGVGVRAGVELGGRR